MDQLEKAERICVRVRPVQQVRRGEDRSGLQALHAIFLAVAGEFHENDPGGYRTPSAVGERLHSRPFQATRGGRHDPNVHGSVGKQLQYSSKLV